LVLWPQVVILSEVPLKYLFSNEKPKEMYTSDEHRSLMDDLALNKDSVSLRRDFDSSMPILDLPQFFCSSFTGRSRCEHLHRRRRTIRLRTHKIATHGNADGRVLATLVQESIGHFRKKLTKFDLIIDSSNFLTEKPFIFCLIYCFLLSFHVQNSENL
jgi:hypothetical protein